MLIIPCLPFAYPDAVKEKEREDYPNLREFLRSVVVPEMQIKLRQGFGRAIRTETDTCVVAVLDPRAARGRRYFQSMAEAPAGDAGDGQPAGRGTFLPCPQGRRLFPAPQRRMKLLPLLRLFAIPWWCW